VNVTDPVTGGPGPTVAVKVTGLSPKSAEVADTDSARGRDDHQCGRPESRSGRPAIGQPLTVKSERAARSASPTATPVAEFSVIPAGRLPLLTDQAYGPGPAAHRQGVTVGGCRPALAVAPRSLRVRPGHDGQRDRLGGRTCPPASVDHDRENPAVPAVVGVPDQQPGRGTEGKPGRAASPLAHRPRVRAGPRRSPSADRCKPPRPRRTAARGNSSAGTAARVVTTAASISW